MESMEPRDFTNLKEFPGHLGNRFDTIMRFTEAIANLPIPIFGLLLFAIAAISARLDFGLALALWAFSVGDWIALALLPRAGKSYGPTHPPTLMLALARAPFVFLPLPWFLVVELIGTAMVLYGFWVEPHRLTLTRQTLKSPKLRFEKPLRVMHLGDIHVERITERERALLRLVREISPDLILYSGDFLNLSYTRDPIAHEHVRSVMNELSAPLGVYAVSGSPGVDPPDVMNDLMYGMENIHWLRDDLVTVEHQGHAIDVVGITCTHKPFLDGPRLNNVLNGKDERFRILLYHTPDLAPEAAAAGVDLQLSGHTHGGQVRLPWFGAFYAASLYGKRFEAGRRQLDQLTLYVTRGIGLEGGGAPRVRFNCSPEVILWELYGV